MITHTAYECEVCGHRSGSREAIAKCEATPVAPINVKPGDLVYAPGKSYGWWEGDESWFVRYGRDAERPEWLKGDGYIGSPKFVVVAVVPYGKVSRNASTGPAAHREAAIVYSPRHANYKGGEALSWTVPGSHIGLVKVGEVSPEELAEYQRRVEDRIARGQVPLL